MSDSNKKSGTQKNYDTVHVMVDVQMGCITHLSLEGAKRYLNKMAETIEHFREKGIDTLWVSIGHNNFLDEGRANVDVHDKRSIEDIDARNFLAGNVGLKNLCEYRSLYNDFIERCGPLRCESIFEKRFLDAFMDKRTLNENPMLYGHLLTHLPDETIDKINSALSHKSLPEHLEEQGIKKVLISGMVSDVCVLESAMGAARRGFKAEILCDATASLRDPEYKNMRNETHDYLSRKLKQIIFNPNELHDDVIRTAFACGGVITPQEEKLFQSSIKMTSVDCALMEIEQLANNKNVFTRPIKKHFVVR